MAAKTGGALLAGVISAPVKHSLSPALHEYWLRAYDIDGAYIPLEVARGRLQDVLNILKELKFRGANVTIPHKEQAFLLTQSTDNGARFTRAANTLWLSNEGEWQGSNTDISGFMENMKRRGATVSNDTHALLIGSGGAARGVAAALLMMGCRHIVLTNRTHDRALSLARYVRETPGVSATIEVTPWDERNAAIESSTLLVNTTSLGMTGQPPLEMEIDRLPSKAVVADIVYNPLQTELLKAAEKLGFKTVDGLGMLLHQAAPGFEKWFGVKPEVTEALRSHIAGILSKFNVTPSS